MGVDVFDTLDESSMKCIRFDVCKVISMMTAMLSCYILNEVHTF